LRLLHRRFDGFVQHLDGKVGLLALDFENGTLILTEAGSKRQASLHVVQGEARLAQQKSITAKGVSDPHPLFLFYPDESKLLRCK